MTTFAIGLNKKVPTIIALCDSAEQAEAAGVASDYEDYTVCAGAKLGETFSLTDLATMFNELPGEEKVTRFADKPSAVKRLTVKALAAKDQLSTTAKPKKAKKPAKPRTGRPASQASDSKIKAKKLEGHRFNAKSPRGQAYEMLKEAGTMVLSEFVSLTEEKLKLARPQALGLIQKLRAVGAIELA